MLKVGDVVADRFCVLNLAGSGGMGAVYRALDRVTGVEIALKVLSGDGDGGDRFQREAGVLADLTHPGIVRYVDHRTDDVPIRYLAMEWLEGEDLADRLRRLPLTMEESLRLARRVAEALGAAHARGVIHRDVKPGNLYLVEQDVAKVKILDFGIAQLTDARSRLTRTGVAVGTPGYMAPEQARGERDIDARSDVFALGCVLYECLAGRGPFIAAHAMAMLGRVLFDRPDPLASIVEDVPPVVESLVDRLLSKERDGRPKDGAEVAAAIAEVERAAAQFQASGKSAPVRAPVPSLTGSEQRIVSVVVAGTQLTTSDGPTAPWTPPDRPAATVGDLRRVAESFGARPEQLADGSLVAVLPGKSLPKEQAARAARCALAMHATWREGAVALVTGRAVVDRVPVGDALDRAASALVGAPLDAVRIDALTADLLDARFDVRRDGKYHKLIAERAEPLTDKLVQTAERTVLGRRTPFVGRDRELSVLRAAWEATMAGAGASAIVITAAPGVGKSRLMAEWVAGVTASADRGECTILSARADVLGGEAPYALLSGALRRWAELDATGEGDPGEVLEARISRLLGPERTAEILPVLAAFALGRRGEALPSMDAVSRGDRMRSAFGACFGAVAAAGPVAMVIEDLHLADAPSVAMLDDALARFAERPFLIVALARPSLYERFDRLWSERSLTTMRLAPLSASASRALVRATVGVEPPDREIDRLLARADGNPLFLEEMIRARAEGAAETLPTTVLGVLEARLDTLDAEARRILRAASIFGDRWTSGGVSALMGEGVSAEAVGEWLQHLAAWEIVIEKRHGGEVTFVFRHDLLREAAYAMLTDDDRRLGHRLAAAWLEKQGGGVSPLVLAEHFERGGDAARARTWLLMAAEGALDANDFEVAIAHAERCAASGAMGRELAAARLVQAEAHGWRGRFGEAHRAALAAAAAADHGSELWFRAVAEIVYTGAPIGVRADVIAWAEKLETEVRAHPDAVSPGRTRSLCRVLIQAVLVGAYPLARRLLALALADDARLPERDQLLAARIHQAHGFVAMVERSYEEALEQHGLAAAAFVGAQSVRQAHFSKLQQSFALFELGRWSEVEALLREGIDEGERMGLSNTVTMMRALYAHALVREGRGGGSAVEAELSRIPDDRGDLRTDGGTRANLALVLLARGDVQGAERAARRALAAGEAFPPLGGRALGVLSTVLLAAGRSDEALAAAAQGVAVLEDLGSILCDESLLRLAHVRALAATGRHEEARAAALEARRSIEVRAERIHADDARRSFLDIPEHRETIVASEAGVVVA